MDDKTMPSNPESSSSSYFASGFFWDRFTGSSTDAVASLGLFNIQGSKEVPQFIIRRGEFSIDDSFLNSAF